MTRWFLLPALASLLAGCVSYSGYDDRYYADQGYEEPVYVGGSSYYSPAHAGRGDYYYQDYGYSSAYIDYPYYYSLFHPLNRWSVDPYWYPGFYYGVTYYPRSYFSFSFERPFRYGYGYAGYRPYGWLSFSYSPYRYGWADSYYDWHSYSYRAPRHHVQYSAPRYGNARNEADWLSRRSDFANRGYRNDDSRRDSRGLPRTQGYSDGASRRGDAFEARQAARGGDYRGRPEGRLDPAVEGFGRRERSLDPRDDGAQVGRGSADRGRGARDEGTYIGRSGDIRRTQPEIGGGINAGGSAAGQRQLRPVRSYQPREREVFADEGIPLETRSRGGYSRGLDSRGHEAGSGGVREVESRSVSPRYRVPSAQPAPSYQPREPVYRETQIRGSGAPQRSFEAPRRETPQRYEAPQQREAPQRYEAPQREAPQRYEAPQREAPQRYEAPRREESSRSESRAESRAENTTATEREYEPG